MKILLDVSEVEDLANKFQVFARKAYPFATQRTVNEAAFKTRAAARHKIKQEFILRNHWTRKGVQVDKARGLDVSRQVAVVGHLDDYMARTEFGGRMHGKGKHGKPIYTAVAAGLPEATRPVKKLPTKANKFGKYGSMRLLKKGRGGGSKSQRNAVAIKQAIKAGKKHVFMETGDKKGLFRIVGRGKQKDVKLVHNLSFKSVRTPRQPWLKPSVLRVQAVLPRIYHKRLIEQARRHGLFGY